MFSTGLLTDQIIDQISHESIVRALWCVQMKHGVSITHLHTDNGTLFRHLGGLGTVPDSNGEKLRLLILLNTIKISASRGQRCNTVEAFISRLKTLWKSGQRALGDMKAYTLLDLDFVYPCMITDLNSVPLDPTISNMSPRDFQLGYKALPIPISFHDRPRNDVMMQKLHDTYQKMNEVYRASKKIISLFMED